MIKFIACIRRNSNITRGEFRQYWLEKHDPLFQEHMKTYQAVRYVQNHILDTPLNESIKKSRGFLEAYDGVGKIWWPSEKAFIEAVNSPACQKLRKMLIKDEAKFSDHAKSSGFFTAEHVLADSTDKIPKSCFCPITGEIMKDPVIIADGYSYEKTAIIAWLAESDKSPITHQLLPNKELIQNIALKKIIETLKQNS